MPKRKNPSLDAPTTRAKGKAKATNQNPGHNKHNEDLFAYLNGQPKIRFQRFRDDADLARFASYFAKAKVYVERSIALNDFNPEKQRPEVPFRVYHWIHNRGWDQAVSNNFAYLDLVREFYCFARVEGQAVTDNVSITSHVRGVDIRLDTFTIRDFYNLPDVPYPEYRYGYENKPDADVIFSELIGYPRTWKQLTSVPSGYLAADYRILYHIVHGCVEQNSSHSALHKEDSYLVYAIGTGVSIDLSKYIFVELKLTIKKIRSGTFPLKSAFLPFGSLISQYLTGQHVPLYLNEAKVHHHDGEFCYKSWKKSLSNKKLYFPTVDPLLDPLIRMCEGLSRGAKGQPIVGNIQPGVVITTEGQQQQPPIPPPIPAPAPVVDITALYQEVTSMKKRMTKVDRTVQYLKRTVTRIATAMNVPHEDPPSLSDEE